MAGRGRRNGDELLMSAIAAGKTVRDAASDAGVSERTAFRRIGDADFRQRVADLRGRMLETVAGRLADTAGAACDRLTKLLDAESPSVQLSAARTILEQSVRWRELIDHESRIVALEERCSNSES